VDFDLNTHQAVYQGNVRVDDPQMKLTCTHLVVYLPESGGRPNRIVAETNVVIDFADEKSQKMHATSDKSVYVYAIQNGATNETVTLTGNAKVENAQGWLTGEPIVWDRASNHLTATNQKMIFRQNLDGAKTGTNLPPGTIQNMDRLTLPPSQP
jgi:lipopolysaccharide transport protein LptA